MWLEPYIGPVTLAMQLYITQADETDVAGFNFQKLKAALPDKVAELDKLKDHLLADTAVVTDLKVRPCAPQYFGLHPFFLSCL